MFTVYAVCSKGKELEAEFTSRELAIECLERADYYMPTIERYEVPEAYFLSLKEDEALYASRDSQRDAMDNRCY